MIQKALSGNEKLWIVFWGYYILAGIILNFLAPLLLLHTGNLFIVITLGFAIWFTWIYFSGSMIWKNSRNTSKPYFGFLAKAVYILFIILGVASLAVSQM